jgi:transcriptional regulator of NAD metabolism
MKKNRPHMEHYTKHLEESLSKLLLLLTDKSLWPLLSESEQKVVKNVQDNHKQAGRNFKKEDK